MDHGSVILCKHGSRDPAEWSGSVHVASVRLDLLLFEVLLRHCSMGGSLYSELTDSYSNVLARGLRVGVMHHKVVLDTLG